MRALGARKKALVCKGKKFIMLLVSRKLQGRLGISLTAVSLSVKHGEKIALRGS
jgi:hypothetical protein